MAESWLKTKGWLKGYVKQKPIRRNNDNSSKAYGVIYYPIKCPNCGSKNVKCYASAPPTRYHKCKDCGKRFKSMEDDSLNPEKVLTTT